MSDVQNITKLDSQKLIDQTLADFFEVSIEQAKNVDQHYAHLWQYLHTLHSSGGKRLRPKIVVMAYTAFGGTDITSITPVACAQELLHFSMLIHDDIIDRDTTRYGVDNITGSYEKVYAPFVTDTADRRHYANSAAIMAGDLMIAAAHKMITESNIEDSQKLAAIKIMYKSMFDVAGGELLDTELAFRPFGSIEPLKVAHYKTASYSFVGPLLTGASLAGATLQERSLLRDFGVYLGIAYQLTDDLLGVFGDESKTGKSNSGDIREGKKTYLIERTLSSLSTDQRSLFESIFGKQDATTVDISLVKDMIISSGGKHDTEKRIDLYVERAYEALSKLSLPVSAYDNFNQLIISATKREF
jgi:geranylgeranyl diphosphate synthase type II